MYGKWLSGCTINVTRNKSEGGRGRKLKEKRREIARMASERGFPSHEMQKWLDCKPGKRRATSCFLAWRHAGVCRGNRGGWWTMLLALVIMSRSCSLGISFLGRLYFFLFLPPLPLSSHRAHLFALTDKFVYVTVCVVYSTSGPFCSPWRFLSPESDHPSCSTFCVFEQSMSRVLILLRLTENNSIV